MDQHPVPRPDADKALIFVVQEIGEMQCTRCALTKTGLDLDPLNSDEGKYLVALSAFTVSHPKK